MKDETQSFCIKEREENFHVWTLYQAGIKIFDSQFLSGNFWENNVNWIFEIKIYKRIKASENFSDKMYK